MLALIPIGNIPLNEAVDVFIQRRGDSPQPDPLEFDEVAWSELDQQRQSLKREFAKPFLEGVLVALVYDPKNQCEFEITRSQWATVVGQSLWDITLLSGPIKFGCETLHSYRGLVPYNDRNEFDQWLTKQIEAQSVPLEELKSDTGQTRTFSRARLETWYAERVSKWPSGKPPPSRQDDETSAREALAADIPREAIREVRNKYSPPEWRKRGRRKRQ